MKLNSMYPAEGATKNRKRIGRGTSSGNGKNSAWSFANSKTRRRRRCAGCRDHAFLYDTRFVKT